MRFLITELGDNQHGRVDRQTDIARHEGICGQLRGQNIRRYPAVSMPDRGRQRTKSNYKPQNIMRNSKYIYINIYVVP